MLLLLLLLGAVHAADPECTREFIVDGMLTWLDSDLDGRITIDEWNDYLLYKPCGPDPLHPLAEHIIANTSHGGCDADGDGALTEADYDAEDSCIARIDALKLVVCAKLLDCQRFNPI